MCTFLGKLILTVCLVAQGYLLLNDEHTIKAFRHGLLSVKDTHGPSYDIIQGYSEYHDSSRYSVAFMFLGSLLYFLFEVRLALLLAVWAQACVTMVLYHNFQEHTASLLGLAKSVSIMGGMMALFSQTSCKNKKKKQ